MGVGILEMQELLMGIGYRLIFQQGPADVSLQSKLFPYNGVYFQFLFISSSGADVLAAVYRLS